MGERTNARLDWRLPMAAAICNALLFSVFLIAGASDYLFDYWLTVFLVSLLLLVGLALSRRRLSIPSALLILIATSFSMSGISFEGRYQARNAIRWLLWSKNFKAELLAQPDLPDKGWRHLDWDDWGFTGNITSAYLVYNPSNLLAEAARTQFAGAVLTPAPRGVFHVQRLEKDWYAVVFPTQTDWEHE